jgi:hypothetical protein
VSAQGTHLTVHPVPQTLACGYVTGVKHDQVIGPSGAGVPVGTVAPAAWVSRSPQPLGAGLVGVDQAAVAALVGQGAELLDAAVYAADQVAGRVGRGGELGQVDVEPLG